MKLYFDTSALIKKYISEKGSDMVDGLFNKADQVFVSVISEIEAVSTLKRLVIEKEISETEFKNLKTEIETDFAFYNIIELGPEIVDAAKRLIEKYQLKSLDSIQLATALSIKNNFNFFIVCDSKLQNAAENEKLKIINPLISNRSVRI